MELILKRDDKNYFSRIKGVKELTPKDFNEIETFKLKEPKSLKIRDSYTFILFYAPWCKFCKETKEVWKTLSRCSIQKKIKIAAFNCEKWGAHCMKMKMDYSRTHKKPFIKTYPMLALYKNSKPFKFFRQERTLENLVGFCEKFINL